MIAKRLFFLGCTILIFLASCNQAQKAAENIVAANKQKLRAPIDLQVVTSVNSITVTWKEVPGAHNYTVYYQANGDPQPTAISTRLHSLSIADLRSSVQYTFWITAHNNLGVEVSVSARLTVTVGVLSANDNKPVITANQKFNLAEKEPAGSTVGKLKAEDADADDQLQSWRIVSGNASAIFALDSETGVLTTASALDYETASQHELKVTVSDGSNLSNETKVVVSISDTNDVAPIMTSSTTGHIRAGATRVLTLSASDADTTGEKITFTLAGNDKSAFTINADKLAIRSAAVYGKSCGNDNMCQLSITPSDGVNTGNAQKITVEVLALAANAPPTANAGNDINASTGQIVTLDGSASSDSDEGYITAYRWSQTSGVSVTLKNRDKAQSGFVVPDLAQASDLEFTLTVTDDSGDTAQDSVKVSVTATQLREDTTAPEVTLVVAPTKGSYFVDETLSILAKASDASGIASVAFYLDDALVSTVTSVPYQYVWKAAVSVGSHRIKAVAKDMKGQTAFDSVTLDIKSATGDLVSDDLQVTMQLNDGNWEKVSVTVKNIGSEAINIDRGALVYNMPSGIAHAVTAKKYQGIDWLSSTQFIRQSTTTAAGVEHRVILDYSVLTYKADTTLNKGEQFSVTLNTFSPAQSDVDLNAWLDGKIRFYINDELPVKRAQVQVTIAAQPDGVSQSSVAVQLDDGNEVSSHEISWGRSIDVVTLTHGASYKLWAQPVQQNGVFYKPNYTRDAPLDFTADSASTKQAAINFSSQTVATASLTLSFTGIPKDLLVNASIVNSLSADANVNLTDLITNSSHSIDLLHGDYTIKINDVEGQDNQVYVADLSPDLGISGDVSLVVDFSKFKFGPVPGLPDHLLMGSITSGSTLLNNGFKNSPLEVIYKYAGPGGNGDRGSIVEPNATKATIAQARASETAGKTVMPMMVVYTAEASGGGWGEEDIVDYDNLVKHNINLIRIVKELQSNKDKNHPKPGGIILNADFLGVLQQSKALNNEAKWLNGKWHGAIGDEAADPAGRDVLVKRSLREAVDYVEEHYGFGRVTIPDFDSDLFGYFQMQNYIIRSYGPDVIFGWQENLWSIGSADWAHKIRGGSAQVKAEVSDKVTAFLQQTGIYSGLWRPDFLVFDKYERDGFGIEARRDYAYNHNDWNNYMEYVRFVGVALNIPIVLWQIPGGHIPTKTENIIEFNIDKHAATAAPYFLGDDRITSLDVLHDDFSTIVMNTASARVATIYHGRSTAKAYLGESPYDWSQNNLQKAINYGVIAILWGGGSTTSVVPLDGNTGNDDGWLAKKVEAYYSKGALPLVKDEKFSNSEPSVDAGKDQEVVAKSTVKLLGTASDSDGAITKWLWSSSSSDITFSNADRANASFVAPKVSSATNYTVQLTVTDDKSVSVSDSVVIKVNPAPKEEQALLTFNVVGTSLSGEEETSQDISVDGGSGTGAYLATSSDSSVVEVTMSATTASLKFKTVGTATISFSREADLDFKPSQKLDLGVTVTASSKKDQSALSVGVGSGITNLSGEAGNSESLAIAGGSGTGDYRVISANTSAVSASIDTTNNKLIVTYVGSGDSNITLYKKSDASYRRSNTVTIKATSRQFLPNAAKDFTFTPVISTGAVDFTITNTSDGAINLRDAIVEFKSPVNITKIDLSPVDSSISWPTSFPVQSDNTTDGFIIKGAFNYGKGDWINTTLQSSASFTLRFSLDTSSLTATDFSLIAIRLVKAKGAQNSNLALPVPPDPVDLRVPGWGSCIAMGTVTDSSDSSKLISDLATSKISSIFKYEGDGFGDRGRIIDASVTQKTITQARAIETQAGSGKVVLPVMVVYTAEGSSGGVAEDDITNHENLYKHYVNLIRTARTIQNSKDALHPNPGSLILNPDLLGEWLLSSYRTSDDFAVAYGDADKGYSAIEIRKAVKAAIDYVVANDNLSDVAVPAAISDNILGFIQAHNFLIRQFAPDVTFGWQQNLWATGSANWVHEDYSGNQHLWDEVSSLASGFFDDLKIYTGTWKPDFLVFDKYEFDGFAGGKGAYAYNARDWKNYLLFVKQVTDHMKTPAMLWQIPGGHMVSNTENPIKFDIPTHSASGGTFFMGDKSVGKNLDNLDPQVSAITLDASVYGVNTVGAYLATDDDYDWGKQQLRLAAYSNVFAILWGGGNTTAVVQVGGSGDDDGWLSTRVQNYYNYGCTKILAAEKSSSTVTKITSISGNSTLDNALINNEDTFNNDVLVYDTGAGTEPSTVYRWNDFLQALRTMSVTGVAQYKFWLGGDDPEKTEDQRSKYGLVNVAAFLAQSMKETIKYNACDENNWTDINVVNTYPKFGSTVYPVSSACGQLGQDYASYGNGTTFACPLNSKMEVSATTNAGWYGAPGPLFSAPDSALEYAGLLSSSGGTARWNSSANCREIPAPATVDGFEPAEQQAYAREDCKVYKNQKAGSYEWDGTGGSVEGCGWWGRGVIQTTGRANFGKLNHYLGRTHLDLRDSDIRSKYLPPTKPIYGDLDLCANPQSICSSTVHPELKWIAGLFYWMSSVQAYDGTGTTWDGWDYQTKVEKYVDDGMNSDSFINEVSGIVNRGCPAASCPGSGSVDGRADRKANFIKVLKTMGLK